MKKALIVVFTTFFMFGCSTKTPEELANNVCECYNDANRISNTTNKLRKIDECFRIVQNNLKELEQYCIDKDLNSREMEMVKDRFYKIYNKCNDSTSEQ